MKKTMVMLLCTLMLCAGALAEECAICGGDTVCDTCNGLGYQEMEAYGGGMTKVACTAECNDGACPTCKKACDACGSDGMCDTCNGLGYQEMEAYGGGMTKVVCKGENCTDGKCSVCNTEASTETPTATATPAPENTEKPIDLNQAYTFSDSVMGKAVSNALNKAGAEITYADLLNVTSIEHEAKARNPQYVKDLSDLEYMPNLQELVLSGCKAKDYSPLAFLTKLKKLRIYDPDSFDDFAALENLHALTELNLSSTDIGNIYDISALQGLESLRVLNLSHTGLTSVYALSALTSLEELNLSYNKISDLSPLASLTNLTKLNLYENKISDISALSSLNNLTWLDMEHNQIEDISPLAALTKMKNLSLFGNQIRDISALASLKNMEMLDLGCNEIRDVSALRGMTKLESLNLSTNYISDFSPVKNLDVTKTRAYWNYNQFGSETKKNESSSGGGSSSSSWSSSSSSSSSTSTRTRDCSSCSNGKVSCTQCGGRGYFEKRVSVPNYSGRGSKYETVKEDCGKCGGLKTQDCSACDGRGKVNY